MEIILFILYGIFLCFIFFYSLIQLDLVINYLNKKRKKTPDNTTKTNEYPFVTIQLPVFNELYVINRLIESVASLNYPKDHYEIQVLDDSTDESVKVAAQKVEEVKKRGVDIKHIRRKDRKGFKAGALANGHEMAKGEFIAIFDADFIPESNFLQNTLPAFSDSKVGLVQTRWEHINEKYSFLTRLQAFGLDAHFSIEQKGRNSAGHFMNFNGTAGVWRKQCIDDAGGWNADTLTEDLDLSYRAQMNGWKFKFLEEVGAPAELPAAMNALKTQQYRWNKGAAECMRKNLPKVLKSKGVQLKTKLHAIFHLMNSFIFLSILSIAFLSIPILVIKSTHPEYQFLFKYATIFILSFFFLTLFYWTSVFKTYKSYGKKLKNTLEFIYLFPLFITVSMGMSLHNGIAVLEGYIGKKSPFIRTPKFNIKKAGDNWKKNKYLIKVLHPLTFLEGFLTLYFFSGIFIALTLGDFDFLPFHIMLTLGFGYVFYYSVKHSKVANN